MAKKRRKQSSRQLDVDDLVALVGALNTIRNGNGHAVAITDPSVNVKELSELRASYEKEIRLSNEKWQERFDLERQRTTAAERLAEGSRVDAKFADVVANALLVQQTTATAASTLASTLANATETLRKSQETTDLATRAAIRAVETKQSEGGGEKVAQAAQRIQGNFNLSQWLVGLGIGVAILLDLRSRGVI